jgi:hypothetical protein
MASKLLYRQQNKNNIGELSNEVCKYHNKCRHLRILDSTNLLTKVYTRESNHGSSKSIERIFLNTRQHGTVTYKVIWLISNGFWIG